VTPVTRLRISEEGEGWFPEYRGRDLMGTVRSSARGKPDPGYQLAVKLEWYVVQLDEVLELQEGGASTPSGFHVVRYSHALVAPRHGESLQGKVPMSCFVKLVREGDPLPTPPTIAELPKRIWATCCLVTEAR
jgi:hypothetical protein